MMRTQLFFYGSLGIFWFTPALANTRRNNAVLAWKSVR